MASLTRNITKPFSRMGNRLVELQRWFPVYVKNDGVGGLSIDPVLYRTSFGNKTPEDEGELNDESNTAGVRVEVIDDDGSTMSGTYTLTISGSGTHTPLAVVNYNGTQYSFLLIAPSSPADGDNTSSDAYDVSGTGVTGGFIDTAGAPTKNLDFTPTMVFMTVQEFAEMLDTYRHIATNIPDENKPSFTPHGLMGRGNISATAPNRPMNGDPRLASNELNKPSQNYANNMKLRASVFMPMMLDNNQFDKRSANATTHFSLPRNALSNKFSGYVRSGISRYLPDPQSGSGQKYKVVGYSGDHLTGAVGAWSLYRQSTVSANSVSHTIRSVEGSTSGATAYTQGMGYSNADISLDSAAAIGPKYRMRMALACFLKDGTYTLNDGGSLIPYTYDPDRTIGGVNSTTLYAVWDGKKGYGNSQPVADDCDAQIYPMFDFVQGPISPSSQGSNFDVSCNELEHTRYPRIVGNQPLSVADKIIQPRQYLVRPNPKRVEVFGIEKSNAGILKLYVKCTSSYRFQGAHGMPIRISGLGGTLGSGETSGVRFNAIDEDNWANDTSNGSNLDHNGWWIMDSVSAPTIGGSPILGQTNYQVIQIRINYGFSTGNVNLYATTGYVSQGRMGGAEMQSATNPLNLYGMSESWKKFEGNVTVSDFSSISQTGHGFMAGLSQPDSTVPSGGSSDSTYPARPVLYDPEQPNTAGVYTSASNMAARGISIRADDDQTFATAPTMSSVGGGVLRIPPAIGWDLARIYYSSSGSVVTSGRTPDTGFVNNASTLNGAPNARWGFRGVHIPFWSFLDTWSGRHGWDWTKPDGWTYGRNRPYPPQERVGTRAAYSPSLLADASLNGWSESASGNNFVASGFETTKVGLSEMACSPIWLDMELKAFIPVEKNRLVMIEFDNGTSYGRTGRHSMMTHGGTNGFLQGHGFYGVWDGAGIQNHPTATTANLMGQDTVPATTEGGGLYGANNPSFTVARPCLWVWGGATDFFTTKWTNSQTDKFPIDPNADPTANPAVPADGTTIGGNHGWGNLGNNYGYGSPRTLSSGMHTMRTVFTEAGMTYILNGQTVGTDTNSANAVWGMTIKIGDALGLGSNSTITNNMGGSVFSQRPNLQMSQSDLQIDQIILRQIPTKPMLPFTVDTMIENVTSAAKYNTLDVEIDNRDLDKGMDVTVTLLEPATKLNNIEVEASTIISGFENKTLDFFGNIGSLDLRDLPSSAYTNGFVIRFNFYIPDNTQTEYHPINWNALPIVRNWTLRYDIKPTVTLTCTGNTFNGDVTPPISTKVGNIVSFRATGTTTDSDRTLSQIKIDFGDGSITQWMDFADQTLTTATFDASHVYTAAGTFSAVAYVKDDKGNESVASSAISVVPAEAKPVANLKVSPALIYAGSSVTLDASSSYLVSTTSGLTIANYTFNSGVSGASNVSQTGQTLSVTYSNAGEYEAQLFCTDSAGNVSATATAILKVLPANTAVDLLGNLNTRPSSFEAQRSANMVSVPVLDSEFPDVTDMGSRDERFVLKGSFLKTTATTDILQMETYLSNGTLLYIEWETTNWAGSSSVQRFTGRMVDFDYEREGGLHGETPYSATFIIDS